MIIKRHTTTNNLASTATHGASCNVTPYTSRFMSTGNVTIIKDQCIGDCLFWRPLPVIFFITPSQDFK